MWIDLPLLVLKQKLGIVMPIIIFMRKKFPVSFVFQFIWTVLLSHRFVSLLNFSHATISDHGISVLSQTNHSIFMHKSVHFLFLTMERKCFRLGTNRSGWKFCFWVSFFHLCCYRKKILSFSLWTGDNSRML